jgi:beta-N-acetylhexosaminidase
MRMSAGWAPRKTARHRRMGRTGPFLALLVATMLAAAWATSPAVARSQAPPSSASLTPVGASTAISASQCARTTMAHMTNAQLVGQLILMGMPSTYLPSATRSVLIKSHIGGVFLIGNSTKGVTATARVMRAARAASPSAYLLRTADQEGGLVQRLQGPGFSDIPSAVDQAKLSDATLTARATIWGRQLKSAWVNVNLAPVADVVPASVGAKNQPIYDLHRGYGSTPQAVSPKVMDFINGMHAGHEGTTVKHFPGIGRVEGNTDFVKDVKDYVTTRHDALLASFDAGLSRNTDMVMVSLVIYTQIDASQPAVFSPTVITGMLRNDRHYTGVVVSDDMNALQVKDLSPSRRALRFLLAGGDLITIGDPRVATAMASALLSRMSYTNWNHRIRVSVQRIMTMKVRRGLIKCS